MFFFAGCSQTPPCADESTVPKATPELGVIPEKNQTGGVEDIKVPGENVWKFQGCNKKMEFTWVFKKKLWNFHRSWYLFNLTLVLGISSVNSFAKF